MASCQHFFCHRIWQRRWHRIPVVICTRAGGGQLSSGCVKPQRHAKLAQIRAAQRTHAQPLSRTAQLMRQQRNTLMTSVDIWSTSMMQHSHHNIRRGHLSSFVSGSCFFCHLPVPTGSGCSPALQSKTHVSLVELPVIRSQQYVNTNELSVDCKRCS